MQSGFDYADIVDEVLGYAVGENSTASDVISAKRSIYMVMEDWHARQLNTWRIKTQDFQFMGGSPRVTLPVELDDVLSVNVLNLAGNETPLRRLSETEYANLTTKDVAGQPTQYVLRRSEQPVLTCTPVGRTGVTETLRIVYIKRPDKYDRFGSDLDAPARWQNALILGAAASLALKSGQRAINPPDVLTGLYVAALDLALTNDRQRKPFRMRIG